MRSPGSFLSLLPLLSLVSVVSSQTSDLSGMSDRVDGGTGLLSNTVITVMDVDEHAALALDVRDVAENLASGDVATAREIYTNGRNSNLSNGSDKRTLREFGTAPRILGKPYLRTDPTLAFHLYGLADLPQRDGDVVLPVEAVVGELNFADRFVLDALAEYDGNDPMLAAEAAVSLNVWFHVAHKLWEAADRCRDTTRAYVAAGENGMPQKELDTRHKAIRMSFDEAFAFYVGRDQSNGDDDGHMLYAHAQKIGEVFTTTDPEAKVNAQMKELYQLGRSALSMRTACTVNALEENSFYHTVTDMTRRMMVPQMQSLVKAINTKDFNRVRLYATAVVPQISSCRYSSFRYLRQELLDTKGKFNVANTERILQQLQLNYSCLGFACKDVGPYLGAKLNLCRDDPVQPVLAGYSTTSNVRRESRIDLDILQIRILMTLEVDYPASLLYRFGRNCKTVDYAFLNGSLQLMATSVLRAAVEPWFAEFKNYFQNQRYADDAVLRTILPPSDDGNDDDKPAHRFAKGSQPQRVQAVVRTLQYQVVYMFVLGKMQEAYDGCLEGSDQRENSLASAWDQAAAFTIGSIEGPSADGADIGDGQSLWNQANALCAEFGTCDASGHAVSNARLRDLFYAGAAQSESFDCAGLRRTISRAEHALLVPFAQSALRYAQANEKRSDTSSHGDLASGHTVALSLLPYVRYYDADAATMLENNMLVRTGVKPVRDGAGAVAEALVPVLAEHLGVACEDVGRTRHSAYVCAESDAASARSWPWSLAVAWTTAVVAWCF